MTRPRRSRSRAEIPDEAIAWLRGGDGGAWLYLDAPSDLAAFWADYRDAIVSEHIAEHPGTRPVRWWQFDAPEPRRRLGGIGTPCHEVLAYVPHFALGLPDTGWISEWQVAFYGSNFRGVPYDPKDPPQFESQAAYLKRLGLLLPGEEKRLTAADFEPEVVWLPPD